MLNLLRSEWYKLFRARSFWVCLIITIILSIGGAFLFLGMSSMYEEVADQVIASGMDPSMVEETMDSLQDVNGQKMIASSFTGDLLQIILIIFVSLFVTMEYSSGCIKNVVAKGYHRVPIYLSKWIVTMVACLIILLVGPLCMVLTGTALWGFGPVTDGLIKEILVFVGTQLLINCMIFSIVLCLSFVLRSPAAAIAVNFGWYIGVEMIYTAFTMILPSENKFRWLDLLPNYQIIKNSALGLDQTAVVIAVCVSIGYLVLSLVGGSFLFKRQDIK